MIVAKVKISGTTATTIWSQKIPKGMTGGRILLEYTDDAWAKLSKTVVFRGAVTKDVLTNDAEVVIPAEVLTRAGAQLSVGVYGTDAGSNVIIPTIWADLGKVYDAADPSGDSDTNPTLPVWAQLWNRVPDWDALPESPNHILNRTHWAASRIVDNTFDGNLTGREFVTLEDGINFVRISDIVVPLEELSEATIVFYVVDDGDITVPVSEIGVQDLSSDGIPAYTVSELVFCVQQDFSLSGITFSAGVYFLCATENSQSVAYTKSLSCLPTVADDIHKLDSKYIDAEWLANRGTGSEILLEEASQPFGNGTPRTSRQTFSFALESGEQYSINWDGETYDCTAGLYSNDYWAAHYAGNLSLADSDLPDTGEPFLVYSIKVISILLGTVLIASGTETAHTVSIAHTGNIRRRIPFSYMPPSYTFPSDFKYVGVDKDELLQAWIHQQNGGAVYASYEGSRYKVLQIKYDLFDDRYSFLTMSNGQYLMIWSQQLGWSRYGYDGFIIGNYSGQRYRISVSEDGNLTVNTTTL